ncbi:MAG: hypothetical protein P0Y53_20715 [Candidatus Pseudobacter hemicellulosilyticus]|uniref:Uncharacterized protein n=1 Tax=Candidatus Pseudobacter hemicellulosilyticus TaxID=3121375 RepID=A0AAJ5WSK7_9BACT|nr:MAG: hypothetical protein P0Y53_20715 [Pseudobacter sp.]
MSEKQIFGDGQHSDESGSSTVPGGGRAWCDTGKRDRRIPLTDRDLSLTATCRAPRIGENYARPAASIFP